MKSTTKYFIYTILAGAFTANQLQAQEADSSYADINYIRRSNAWLTSKNAAGLTRFNAPDISDLSIYLKNGNGGLKNYFQSDDLREYGVTAESFTRLNDKVVLAGGVSYKNNRGNNMTGSSFINPYDMPLDLVDLDPANKGTKELELYHLKGAVGAQLTPRLSIGGQLNYQAGNFAKRKDLRHTNKLLFMEAGIGAIYKINKLIEVGADYTYNRRIESISFKAYGNTDKSFQTLVSFGSFYGRPELFSQYGYTSSQNANPLKDITHGGSIQLNFNIGSNIKLLNEFSVGAREGFFGEEGTSSILLTKHTGNDLAYQGNLSIRGVENEHHIRMVGTYNQLINKETIYRRETTAGGVDRIIYYGDNEVFLGENLNLALDYSFYMNVKNGQPKWAMNVLTDYAERKQETILYPFTRKQDLKSFQIMGSARRHFQRKKDAFNFGLGVGFSKGSGDISRDLELTPPAESSPRPTSMEQFLNEEYEYLTSAQFKGNINAKYVKALKNGVGAYVKLSYDHRYGPKVTYLGKHYSAATASLGLTF